MASLDTSSLFQEGVEDGFQPYRSVSKAAAFSVVLTVFSIAGLLFPIFLILALIGAICGVIGFRNASRYPLELTGRIPAAIGAVLGLLVLICGTTHHSVVYATEVPEGYERLAFNSLKAEARGPDVPPESILQLDGQRVFIKGYVYPGEQRVGIRRFVLVPDLGTCCFGGQPKLTHMIQVTMADELTIDYSMRKRKLAGVLKVSPQLKPGGGEKVGGVYYELEAEYVR